MKYNIGGIMPTISSFYGINVTMYFNDHEPPHIHISYSGEEALISIRTKELLEGSMKPQVRRMVLEWMEINEGELIAIWETKQFRKIKPLE